jgi:hypothetical protein
MERWEYWTGFLYANVKNEGAKEFLQQRLPNWPDPPRYAPQAMMPELDTFGEEGWELVHMQPVAGVGSKADVYFQGAGHAWSNAYFCVFKRRKHE